MAKIDVLKGLNFGQRVAEDEEGLSAYFVETDQWRSLFNGDVDIVYGPKGSGKSALYSLLIARENALFDRSIVTVSAENPRGAPVFADLATDPPASEQEFVYLWKLYFTTLVADVIDQYEISGEAASKVKEALEIEGLVLRGRSLRGLLRAVKDYASKAFRVSAIEAGAQVDPILGMPTGFSGKITFREPSADNREAGFQSIDQLLDQAQKALEDANFTAWILLDRLDVAFAEDPELETNALRALFRVYRDIVPLVNLRLKIFLRTDIWNRITAEGFREASHLTRSLTITWDKTSLLHLIIKRVIQSQTVLDHFAITETTILESTDSQEEFFYRMFPDQVDFGPNKPKTFEWILTRTQDGAKDNAPRELIHLLNCLKDQQVKSLEIGATEPAGERLFTTTVFKGALQEVSRVRLEQTLFAEYPGLKPILEQLRGGYTQQTIPTLSEVWGMSPASALASAQDLVRAAFFEQRGTRENPEYWVPFIYRDALNLIQGGGRKRSKSTSAQSTQVDI